MKNEELIKKLREVAEMPQLRPEQAMAVAIAIDKLQKKDSKNVKHRKCGFN